MKSERVMTKDRDGDWFCNTRSFHRTFGPSIDRGGKTVWYVNAEGLHGEE